MRVAHTKLIDSLATINKTLQFILNSICWACILSERVLVYLERRMEDVDMKSPFKSPEGRAMLQGSYFESPLPTRLVGDRSSSERLVSNVSDENEAPNAGASTSSSMVDHSRVNPFERDVLSSLSKSFWSPSIMVINETPPQRSWAIEHLSHLFPKDIENSPSTHQNAFPVDAQMEAKAQADIETYFSRGQIVPTPSPMKDRNGKVFHFAEISKLSKSTVSSHVTCQSPIARGGTATSLSSNALFKKKKLTTVTEKWTQTALSFPVDLPPQIYDLLSSFSSQDIELCGSASEGITYCSQKSEASEAAEVIDNDSGKNSSSLNNSIRRRLELSFGDDPEGEDTNTGIPSSSTSPIMDPFRQNHLMSTPPPHHIATRINTTTSELELQLMRCEFTPEARGITMGATPGITPIVDAPDEPRFDTTTCSTPKRSNGNFKRWTLQENPTSPMSGSSNSTSSATGTGTFPAVNTSTISSTGNNNGRINLRRSHTGSFENVSRKISSASSFDDSQFLMDASSPPAKLYRRNSDNVTS